MEPWTSGHVVIRGLVEVAELRCVFRAESVSIVNGSVYHQKFSAVHYVLSVLFGDHPTTVEVHFGILRNGLAANEAAIADFMQRIGRIADKRPFAERQYRPSVRIECWRGPAIREFHLQHWGKPEFGPRRIVSDLSSAARIQGASLKYFRILDAQVCAISDPKRVPSQPPLQRTSGEQSGSEQDHYVIGIDPLQIAKKAARVVAFVGGFGLLMLGVLLLGNDGSIRGRVRVVGGGASLIVGFLFLHYGAQLLYP